MEPRKEVKQEPEAPQVREEEPKPRLQIVKLEQRIAPGVNMQHNETLVREPAKAKPKAAKPRKGAKQHRLQIVKLEQRIAPGVNLHHNETLVRDRSPRAR
jgi:hypothetical protein